MKKGTGIWGLIVILTIVSGFDMGFEGEVMRDE